MKKSFFGMEAKLVSSELLLFESRWSLGASEANDR